MVLHYLSYTHFAAVSRVSCVQHHVTSVHSRLHHTVYVHYVGHHNYPLVPCPPALPQMLCTTVSMQWHQDSSSVALIVFPLMSCLHLEDFGALHASNTVYMCKLQVAVSAVHDSLTAPRASTSTLIDLCRLCVTRDGPSPVAGVVA
jgi:hypothetical protein